MHRRVIAFTTVAVIALTLAFAAVPAFADPPSPSFDVTCTVGGDTTVQWKHARVLSIDADWYDSTGTLRAQLRNANPRGLTYSQTTPNVIDVGGEVRVTLFLSGGLGAELAPETCT